jgi:hypothetical protein
MDEKRLRMLMLLLASDPSRLTASVSRERESPLGFLLGPWLCAMLTWGRRRRRRGDQGMHA